MLRERELHTLPGGFVLALLILGTMASVAGVIGAARAGWGLPGWVATLAFIGAVIAYRGLFVVNPNQPKVVQLLGGYLGTVQRPGFHWVNPLTMRKPVSTRVRNFESARLKVNDHIGNPIEIAAVVVWRVVGTALAGVVGWGVGKFVPVRGGGRVVKPYLAHVDGRGRRGGVRVR